jgi:hypothetical protein
LIILITLGEGCKSRSSSLCSFLHPPVISSLSGSYPPRHPVLKHLQSLLLP